MRTIKEATICFLLAFSIGVQAQIPITRIDTSIQSYLNKYAIPGLQVAITRNGKMVYFKSYGYSNLESQTLTTNSDRFRIGSISKTITAIGIMKLISQGIINLDDKVFGDGAILGYQYGNTVNYSDKIKAITIDHLLHHTAGWYNEGEAYYPDYNTSQLISALINEVNHEEPGNAFTYSNFGVLILGRIIEEVTGISYETYIQNEILHPYGINNMTMGGEFLADRKINEVKYYNLFYNTPAYENKTVMESAGWWIATAAELCKVFTLIDAKATRPEIFTPEILNLMLTGSDANPSYGTALMLGGEKWSHNGAMSGTMAWAGRFNDDFCYAVMVNAGYSINILNGLSETVYDILNDTDVPWQNIDLYCPNVELTPTSLNETFITSHTSTLSWNHAGDGPFSVEYKKSSDLVYNIPDWVLTKSFVLKDLIPGTNYDWRVRTECSGFQTGGFTTLVDNYCKPQFTLGCGGNYGIKKISIEGSGLSVTSTCGTGGYTANLLKSYFLGAGQTYTFTVLKNSTEASALTIWLDLNANGAFESGEKLYNTIVSSSGSETMTGSFSIPANSPELNWTRLRFLLKSGTAATDPCDTYTSGEAEDYLVNIKSCPNNFAVSNLKATGITAREALLSWYNLTGGPYLIEYRKVGSPTWVFGGWPSDRSKKISGLQPSTSYEWRVKTPCSIYSSGSFQTLQDYCDIKFLITGCSNVGISSVQVMGAFSSASDCSLNEGYTFSNLPIELMAGSRYTVNIRKFQTEEESNLGVWLDINGNTIFEENEKLYFSTVPSNTQQTSFYFDIPDIPQDIFNTRIRVIVKSGALPLDGCGTYFTSGEAEDFQVNIGTVNGLEYIYRPPTPSLNHIDQAIKGIILYPGTLIDSQQTGTYSGLILSND